MSLIFRKNLVLKSLLLYFISETLIILLSPGLKAGDFVHLTLSPFAVQNTSSVPGTPIGIAVDASDHVMMVTSENIVYKLSSTGIVNSSVELSGSGTPVAIAMDDIGNVFVASDNGDLYKLSAPGLGELAHVTIEGATPVDLIVSGTGHVYVIASNGNIYKRGLNLTPMIDNNIPETPTAIDIDHLGRIFITTLNGKVYRLTTGLSIAAEGTITDSPVLIDVCTDVTNHTIIAGTQSLYSITTGIGISNTITLSETIVGVDIDQAGDVVAATEDGIVYVTSAFLSGERHTSTSISLNSICMNLTGDIYAVGGTGTELIPEASFSTTFLDFEEVEAGASKTLYLEIENTGTAPLEISSTGITTSDPSGVWTINPVVPPTMNIDPSETQDFDITLIVPPDITSDVNYDATIRFVTNSHTDPEVNVIVEGTGHFQSTEACYSTSDLTFGQINSGSNRSRAFTVTNCGDLPLEIQEISLITSDPSGVWEVSPEVSSAITLESDENRTFTVTLTVPPDIVTDVTYNADIRITTNDQINPPEKIITASGTGHIPIAKIYIDPIYYDIDFREVEIGFQFGKPLMIENNGDLDLDLEISYANPTDPDRSHFNLETEATNFTIPPYGNIIFRQTFAPTDAGFKNIELLVHNTNDPTFSEQIINLHGEGTTPIPIDAVLILDRSGSMSEMAGEIVKIDALSNAAKLFTQLLALRGNIDYLGLTKYNHENSNILDLGQINTVESSALSILSDVGTSGELYPSGATGIGGAIRTASEQYALSPDPDGHKKIMIVLTDGKENRSPRIRDILDGYDSYPGLFTEHPDLFTYSIGLGIPSNINQDRLQEITNRGEGGFYFVTGNLQGLNLFNLENFYFKIFADAIDHSMLIDPTYTIGVGEVLEIPFNIITDDREAIFFFIGEFPENYYTFEFIDPRNNVITSNSTIGEMFIHTNRMNNWSIFRVKFPPADITNNYVGAWKFRVRFNIDQSDSLLKLVRYNNSLVGFDSLYKMRHRISFAASVGSNYKMNTNVGPEVVLFGEKLYLRASLTENGWPAQNASVTATIHRSDGEIHTVDLFDDGIHMDDALEDGIFGGIYTGTIITGVYQIDFRSQGITERGEHVTRVSSCSQFIGIPSEDPEPEDCISCLSLKWLIAIIIILLILILLFIWRCLYLKVKKI